MTIQEIQALYATTASDLRPNKLRIPINRLHFEDYEEFNRIYQWARENLMEVQPTPSGGFPYGYCKYRPRYTIVGSPISVELVVWTYEFAARFLVTNKIRVEGNTITGRQALKTLKKTAEDFGVIDTFLGQMVTKEEGLKIKETIDSPLIDFVNPNYERLEIPNCHHLDFNSAYASKIAEKHPELRPMYEYLYEKRKENNGLFKHVLTNSIGAMQSQYCINFGRDDFNQFSTPYALAQFSKEAINGNVLQMHDYVNKLIQAGREPILLNTDGIWYTGDLYHDELEGEHLGQWKNDHKNCLFYAKSKGAYQFIENGVVKTVLRGYTNLDNIKPRDQWGWREIDKVSIVMYEFNEKEGITKNGI